MISFLSTVGVDTNEVEHDMVDDAKPEPIDWWSEDDVMSGAVSSEPGTSDSPNVASESFGYVASVTVDLRLMARTPLLVMFALYDSMP